jgi:hypothetical protein
VRNEDGDDTPVVRVTAALMHNAGPNEDRQKPATGADADDTSIILDPDLVEDLEELLKIGFSRGGGGVNC